MNERRIATVLRVRELHERIARSEVARRRLELERERQAEHEAWQDLRERSADAPGNVSAFLGHRAMLGGGVTVARQAGERVAVAGGAVTTAVDDWQVEAQRLDGIERLADRIRSEAAAERERKFANEMDDLVVMRHPQGADR